MNNKIELLEVEIDVEKTTVSLKKLLPALIQSNELQLDQQSSFWEIIEQLELNSFIALKTNVYFADLLKSISITNQNASESIPLESELIQMEIKEEPEVEADILPQPSLIVETTEEPTQELIVIPPLDMKLNEVVLPDRFQKLIKRLKKVSLNHARFKFGDRFIDLINLSTEEVVSLSGVGASYIDTLTELKELAKNRKYTDAKHLQITPSESDSSQVDITNFRISLSGVAPIFIKPLEKYSRHSKIDDISMHLDQVLKFDRSELISLPGFGRGVVDSLIEFKHLVVKELEAICKREIDVHNFESNIIVPKVVDSLSLDQIEQLLLDDIDTFLEKLSDDDTDIIQRRWGFVEDKETLEDIGADYGLTRERIRQKSVQINTNFLQNLRISPSSFWVLLEPELDIHSIKKLPALFSCFSTEKVFYEFLDLVCLQTKLYEFVYPEIDKSILNTYFAENGAPIHFDDAVEYLRTLQLPLVRNLSNAIQSIAVQGVLLIEGDYIWPKMLGKSEASACVLVNHRKGYLGST